MRQAYETDAKKAIISFLKNNRERHFTVEEITTALAAENFSVSRSTVYRRISRLLADGDIRRFESAGTKNFVYQYADMNGKCRMHFHLKCLKCGRLVHMDCERMQQIKKHIYKEHGFIIGGEAVINGICSECYREGEQK